MMAKRKRVKEWSLREEVERAAREVRKWPAWMRDESAAATGKKKKAIRRISVSHLIRMVVKEGYAAAKIQSRMNAGGYDTLTHNFRIALDLAKKLGAHRNTIDFVLRDYVARSRRTNRMIRTIELPSPNIMLEFSRLGASRPAVELLTREFARRGSTSAFLSALRLLGRKPEEAEVRLLVEDYVKGPTGGAHISDTEEELIKIAGVVSKTLADEVSEKLALRRQRLAFCCD